MSPQAIVLCTESMEYLRCESNFPSSGAAGAGPGAGGHDGARVGRSKTESFDSVGDDDGDGIVPVAQGARVAQGYSLADSARRVSSGMPSSNPFTRRGDSARVGMDEPAGFGLSSSAGGAMAGASGSGAAVPVMRQSSGSKETKTFTKAAVIGARAAWSLNEWGLMDSFVSQLPPDNIDACFMRAVRMCVTGEGEALVAGSWLLVEWVHGSPNR